MEPLADLAAWNGRLSERQAISQHAMLPQCGDGLPGCMACAAGRARPRAAGIAKGGHTAVLLDTQGLCRRI